MVISGMEMRNVKGFHYLWSNGFLVNFLQFFYSAAIFDI